MQVRLLGPVDVTVEGVAREVPGLRRKAILAALALKPGEVLSTDRLLDIVWGSDAAARLNTLQSHVSYLRRLLGGKDSIVARSPGYQLSLAGDATDLAVAERLIEQAGQDANRADGAAAFRAALALWRGRPLADVADLGWFGDQAQRIEHLRLTAIEGLARARLELGEHADLIAELEPLARQYPFQERLHGHLMLALYRAHRQHDALAVYQRLAAHLDEELGIRPSTSLRDLHTAILRQDPQLEPSAPAVTVTEHKPARPVPAQLPASVRAFVGRAGELANLDSALTATSVAAVSGTAGVGKTTLAVYWAHRVADRFPDGQLYVDLRGFDPGRAPLDPGEVLRGFLDALGVPPRRVPVGLDAQLGLYRTVLAGKRVLLLLDNARDADQVRPLLPGAPGCLAVVTSRDRLTALVATQGARPLSLSLLTAAESRELLGRRLGGGRVAGELQAAQEIITRCAGLPLALAIVAARAETDTGVPLSALADELKGPLDTLTAGDESTDLRAVFSWSTRAVSPQAAGLFWLIGLHPGPDLTVPAAASLTGKPAEQARAWLRELVRAHLLTEHLPGRFTLHDLLRAYAAEGARTRCDEQARTAATHRMLDHYLHSVQDTARLLSAAWDLLPVGEAQPGVVPERFADKAQADGWLQAEYQVLLGCIEYAAGAGFERHAWQLARTLSSYFERSGHWQDWLRAQQTAVDAARRAGDLPGQAHSHHQLGYVLAHLGDHGPAHAELALALALFGDLGDDTQRALVHLSIGYTFDHQGADEEAIGEAWKALRLYRSAGHRLGEGVTLNNIGWSLAQQGQYAEALERCGEALHLLEQADDRQVLGGVWDSLGYIHYSRGDHGEAIACYRKAADISRQIDDVNNEAEVLVHLGDAYHAAGDIAGARDTWRQALRLHEALHHPDTNEVRRRLLEATDAGLVYNANLLNAHWGNPANHDGTIGRLGMRMTRPAAMLAALTLTVAVAACSSTSSSSGGTPAGKAQQGGTVTVAWTNATPNFIFPFPPATNTDGYNANLTNPMWPTLSVDGDGAQSVVNRRESLYSSLTFGNGNKTVTMVLKSWKWSDGAPITSRDFTFVYNLLKTNYQNWNSYIPGTFPVDVTGVSATDAHTVVLTLSQPTSPDFFADNVLNNVPLIPQHAWDKESATGAVGDYDQTPAGAKAVYGFLQKEGSQIATFTTNPLWKVVDGPWTLSTFNTDGTLYGYVPNKNYSGSDKPRLAKVLNQSFTTSAALVDALRAGSSVQVGPLPLDDVNQLGQLKAEGYSSATRAIPGVAGMEPNFWNAQVGAVFRQLYIRQAMEELINRPQLVAKVYHGYADPGNGPVPVLSFPSWVSPVEKAGGAYPYDPQAAITLLKSHGWKVVPNGVSTCQDPAQCGPGIAAGQQLQFELAYSAGTSTTDEENAAIQSSEEQAGIKLDLKPEPFNTLVGTVGTCTAKSHAQNCGWQIAEFGYSPYPLYPADNGNFVTGGVGNSGGYSDPKTDSLISATLTGSSQQAFFAYEDYVAQQLPWLWLPLREGVEVYKSNLAGYTPLNPFLGGLNPEDWYYTK